jgi:branched-chain amino acid transport system ATP-binding protein
VTARSSILEIRDINAGYNRGTVINKLSLDVPETSIVAIIGPNGAGKTTLLKCVVGLVRVRAGEIGYNGKLITNRTPDAVARLGLSLVPEGRRIFTTLSVADNLAIGAQMKGRRFDVVRQTNRMLEYFPELSRLMGHRGGALSGGEQQMLAIARALMADPRLLLIDEASLGLAPIIVSRLAKILPTLREELHLTVLMVEQGAALASLIADQIHVMTNGALVGNEEGEYNELVRQYASYGSSI